MMPVSLMHGYGWQRCCICFEGHVIAPDGTWPTLHRDPEDGKWWDVCVGQCAVDAGLVTRK